jgi:hypothetical protein
MKIVRTADGAPDHGRFQTRVAIALETFWQCAKQRNIRAPAWPWIRYLLRGRP